jgi:membrane protease YdiL (CAAX protease family)
MVTFAPRLTPLHLLVSSLQFASVHQANAGSLLGIGVTGLCLGTSYLASGRNLLVPIIAHALFNLAAAVYVAMQP